MAIFTLSPDLPQAAEGAGGAAEPHQRVVHQRLKASYGPTYLTILSVIQAVAMGDLAQVVAAGYHDFTSVQWVLTLNTFGVLIIIWNAYSVQSALWGWIPDVRDSAVPFVVGALELYLNHTITVSLSAWLVAMSLVGVAGAFGTLYISRRARREVEHRELLRRLSGHFRLYIGYLLVGGGLLLALSWVCADERLLRLSGLVGSAEVAGRVALGVALLSAGALGGGVYVLHRLWREAVVYAQADQDHSQRTTAKGVHALRIRHGRHRQPSSHSTPSASDTTRNSGN